MRALILQILLIGFIVYRLQPPSSDIQNALSDLSHIAARPHPMGTPEHTQVRDYLRQTLLQLGLETEVQTETVAWKWWGIYRAGTAYNVIGRLKGAHSTGAILLVGHYDTVPNAPGATDNGSAVAAILETLRVLKSQPALQNDVIALFTDGEEIGVYGAQAFTRHPWAKDVRVMIHFDSGGTGGPVTLIETSHKNSSLLQHFARTPHPVATSLLFDVWENTQQSLGDFAMLNRAGIEGYDLGSGKHNVFYHTSRDNIENIDHAFLGHLCSYALSLTKEFGNVDFSKNENTSDTTYFDLFSYAVIRYPESWALPLAIFSAVGFFLVWKGAREKGELLKGAAFGVPILVVIPLITWLVVKLLYVAHPQYGWIPQGDTYNSTYYLFAFLALAFAVCSLLATRFYEDKMWNGIVLLWMILSLVTAITHPRSAYLLTIPAIVAFASGPISVAVALILWIPVICLLFWNYGLSMMAVVMLPVALLFTLAAPQLRAKKHFQLVCVGIAFGCFVIGALTSGFDSKHPLASKTVFYALDADHGKAYWATDSGRTDDWSSLFLKNQSSVKKMKEFFPMDDGNYRVSGAPAISLDAPQLRILREETSQGKRSLDLQLFSSRKAASLNVYVNAKVISAEVNGQNLEETPLFRKEATGSAMMFTLAYNAPPPEGIELKLIVETPEPFTIQLVDRSYSLPVEVKRPSYMMPAPAYGGIFYPNSDSTIVEKIWRLGR